MLIVQLLIRDPEAETVRKIARLHGTTPEETLAGLVAASIQAIRKIEQNAPAERKNKNENLTSTLEK